MDLSLHTLAVILSILWFILYGPWTVTMHPPNPLHLYNARTHPRLGVDPYLPPFPRSRASEFTYLTKPSLYFGEEGEAFKALQILDQFGWTDARTLITPARVAQRRADLIWVTDDQPHRIVWHTVQPYQVVSAIVGDSAITTKGMLATALWDTPYMPETYRTYVADDCTRFRDEYVKTNNNDVWLTKPTDLSNGQEVQIWPGASEAYDEVRSRCKTAIRKNQSGDASAVRHMQGVLIQRYIRNPLLLDGCKSETRVYWFIISPYRKGDPWRAYVYRDGIVRRNVSPYNPDGDFTDVTVHVTNVKQQKKHPDFEAMKPELKWNYTRWRTYLHETHDVPDTWFAQQFWPTVRGALQAVVERSVKRWMHDTPPGSFGLYGADFIVDTNLRTWLTEIQMSPGLSIDHPAKRELIPEMLRETMDIVLERREMRLTNREWELTTLKRYALL